MKKFNLEHSRALWEDILIKGIIDHDQEFRY